MELRRPPYNERAYRVPASVLETLRDLRISFEDARSPHDGVLCTWKERRRFDRDGKAWVLLQESGYEYAVEIELTPDGGVGEVVPVAPDQAYALARAHDHPSIIAE